MDNSYVKNKVKVGDISYIDNCRPKKCIFSKTRQNVHYNCKKCDYHVRTYLVAVYVQVSTVWDTV